MLGHPLLLVGAQFPPEQRFCLQKSLQTSNPPEFSGMEASRGKESSGCSSGHGDKGKAQPWQRWLFRGARYPALCNGSALLNNLPLMGLLLDRKSVV